MKVLLLQPPVQDFYDTDIRLQPIGLAYIKAAIRKHLPGVRVIIKPYHHSRHRKTLALPKEFSYLKDFYAKDDKSPFSSFHHYYHFGADFETIAKEVASEKPDLVGISSLFSPYYREALACAAAIKKKWNVPILFGGSHVSTMPEFTLSHPAVDFVIRGEGEKPWVELLKKGVSHHFREMVTDPFSKVPNLAYKKNGKIVLNPCVENYPINGLPFPDFSDLPQTNYLFEKKPLCFIVTSRGCPYQCSFCSVHKTFGHRYRRRSTGNILDEMKARYGEGYRVFDFEDDNFAFNKKETKELCEKIARSFPKKDIRLLAMNGICYWTLDRETLNSMRRAGFTHLNLSLVSTNTRLLKAARRPGDLKKYTSVVKAAAKLGFKTVSYQILGLPGDSVASMVRTLIFHAKLPVLLGASPFYLIPHSPIALGFEELTEADIYKARLTAMAVETREFSREDIYTLFITTRILNFLKGVRLDREQTSFKKALGIAKKKDARSAAGIEVLKKLFAERRLYAWTPGGFEPLPRFRSELFFRVWHNLDRIVTQEGKFINLSGEGS